MDMIDAVVREKVGEVKRVARPLPGLESRAIFSLVKIDNRSRPFATGLRFFFPNPQNLLRRRVTNRRAQSGEVLVTQAGERWINRADFKRHAELFQSQHLRVAKGLRDDRVTRGEITKSQRPRGLIVARRNSNGRRSSQTSGKQAALCPN